MPSSRDAPISWHLTGHSQVKKCLHHRAVTLQITWRSNFCKAPLAKCVHFETCWTLMQIWQTYAFCRQVERSNASIPRWCLVELSREFMFAIAITQERVTIFEFCISMQIILIKNSWAIKPRRLIESNYQTLSRQQQNTYLQYFRYSVINSVT